VPIQRDGVPLLIETADVRIPLLQADHHIAFASLAWAEGTHKDAAGFVPANPPGSKPYGLEVCFGSKDIEATFKAALDAGFAAHREPFDTPWGSRMAYLRDPDGHMISLSADRAKKEESSGKAPAETEASSAGGSASKRKRTEEPAE